MWAFTKVTSRLSKMSRHKSYLTDVLNGGEGGQGHFWTMSKRKVLFFLMASLIKLGFLLEKYWTKIPCNRFAKRSIRCKNNSCLYVLYETRTKLFWSIMWVRGKAIFLFSHMFLPYLKEMKTILLCFGKGILSSVFVLWIQS